MNKKILCLITLFSVAVTNTRYDDQYETSNESRYNRRGPVRRTVEGTGTFVGNTVEGTGRFAGDTVEGAGNVVGGTVKGTGNFLGGIFGGGRDRRDNYRDSDYRNNKLRGDRQLSQGYEPDNRSED